MEIKVGSNAKKVARQIGKKGKQLSDSVKRALLITGQVGLTIIEDRTAKGEQINGLDFAPYSEEYTWFRAKNGRNVSNVDLSFTGQMLSSMTVKSSAQQAEIFFTRATESKKAAMNNKTRPFFGFNKDEEKRLGKVFFRYLK